MPVWMEQLKNTSEICYTIIIIIIIIIMFSTTYSNSILHIWAVTNTHTLLLSTIKHFDVTRRN